MDTQRIGQVLERLGTLSGHDIDEILSEQRATGQRFGTIAVAMGFCQPEHIWAAWCDQLNGRVASVDLDEIGVDAQAADFLPRSVAFEFHAMPIRVWEGQLVVAVTDLAHVGELGEIARRTGLGLRCVMAGADQIDRAIVSYYGPTPAH